MPGPRKDPHVSFLRLARQRINVLFRDAPRRHLLQTQNPTPRLTKDIEAPPGTRPLARQVLRPGDGPTVHPTLSEDVAQELLPDHGPACRRASDD